MTKWPLGYSDSLSLLKCRSMFLVCKSYEMGLFMKKRIKTGLQTDDKDEK